VFFGGGGVKITFVLKNGEMGILISELCKFRSAVSGISDIGDPLSNRILWFKYI
jgi:hypothetical protein